MSTYEHKATRWTTWDTGTLLNSRLLVGHIDLLNDGKYGVVSPDRYDPTHYDTRANATKALLRHYETGGRK